MESQQSVNQCAALLHAADERMRQRDFTGAQALLAQAHTVGHASRSCHLCVHRALVRLGVRAGNPAQVVSQSALLVLAFLFD